MSVLTAPCPDLDPSVLACLAGGYLREHPRRWTRTQALAARAEHLAEQTRLTGPERDLLVGAAWLIEIGHAHHRDRDGWPVLAGADLARDWSLEPVAALLAWRSAAPEEAALRGVSEHQTAFPRPFGPAALLLTVADVTTGPHGRRVTLSGALVGVRARHGQDSVQARALESAWARLSPLVAALA